MRRILIMLSLASLIFGATYALAEDNATHAPKPQEQAVKPAQGSDTRPATTVGKLPLDIQSKGSDPCGTLLSYKLKDEIVGSKVFELKTLEKKKFVLHIITQAEFSDRPNIASQYSIALVYQEDASNLTYYLDQYQGQVSTETVTTEMQRILEWSYAALKRFHYLLED